VVISDIEKAKMFWENPIQVCIGGYTRVYAVYQRPVFLTAYTYLICHNKTGYTGIYALTVNKRMCTAPWHTKMLNFFPYPCTFGSACNAYLWEALLVCYIT